MYKIKFSDNFVKQLEKLDKFVVKNIKNWINKNLVGVLNPRLKGKELKGDLKGIWRYRVGDYRILAEIKDKELIILLLKIAHRKKVYKSKKEKKMKKYFSLFFLCIILILQGCNNTKNTDNDKIKVMATIFPIYDICREISKNNDNIELSWLLDNGVDLHNFNPSADDIINIGKQDLFFYIGGESDKWVSDVNVKGKKYSFMDEVKDILKEEEVKEGMEEEHEHEHGDGEEHEHEHGEDEIEYDEHIWLSPKNAKYIAIHIEKELSKLDPKNVDLYEKNLDEFLSNIKTLDESYTKTFATRNRKIMLFADRFPFRYLCDDYGIEYFAAFAGCSAETEASFKTIKFLTDKVDEYNLRYIWVLENSDKKIADTIISNAENKDVLILTLDSMQSVNKADAADGTTYLGLLKKNYQVLSDAYGE